jgi:RNA polymerase sigma factor (sigma-70 family)
MNDDTDLGGPPAFPATRCTLVRATTDPDPAARRQAFENLIAAYWKPVYKYLRVRWALSNEDAMDLTQAFFARALEKDFFDRFDPARARYRTFLRACVDGFAANARRDGARQKRGGDVRTLSLDFAQADGELARHPLSDKTDMDDFFRQEWMRGLFALGVEDLRRHCAATGREIQFALFQCYDLDGPVAPLPPTYTRLAEEFGISVTQVTNYLAQVRRQFRQFVLDRLRATTGDEEEFREESRRLFGSEP